MGIIGSSIVWLCLDDFFICGSAFLSKLWLSAYNLNITVLKRSCSTSPSTPTKSNYPSHPLRHRTGFQVEYCISLKWTSTVHSKFWTNVHKKSSSQLQGKLNPWRPTCRPEWAFCYRMLLVLLSKVRHPIIIYSSSVISKRSSGVGRLSPDLEWEELFLWRLLVW